jgi:hypothetical protein
LTLFLAPDGVQALHTRGWGARLVALEHIALDGVEPDDWSTHLASCSQCIDKVQPGSVCVVVSDRLVRYLPLAWNADIQGAQEEISLAQIEFEETYSEGSAADWSISTTFERPGMNRLLSAMPVTLLEGLKELCLSKKVRLASVKPNLIAVVQGMRRQISSLGWFVNLDGPRLTMLHWKKTGCDWVATGRCEAGDIDSAITALRRERVISGALSEVGAGQLSVYFANASKPLNAIVQCQDVRVNVLGQSARTLARLRASKFLQITEDQALQTFGGVLLGADL